MPLARLGARRHAAPHDHAVATYATEEELIEALDAFLAQGCVVHDTTVFVHSFTDDDAAWRFLARRRPDVTRLGEDELVLVSLYSLAFEREGRIVHEHAAGVVAGLRERARRRGRGLRIFVDASHLYLAGGRKDEWFAFESWLGTRLQADVALVCAYRRATLADDPDALERALRTHAYRFRVDGRSAD